MHTCMQELSERNADWRRERRRSVDTLTTKAWDDVARFGFPRVEACNNLLFVLGFNTYDGVKIVILSQMKWVGLAGKSLHRELTDEIRTVG